MPDIAETTTQPNPPAPPVEAKPTPPPAHRRIALPATADSFYVQGFKVATYDAMIPIEHTLEDILVSSYWMHHASKIQLYGIIRAFHLGGEFDVDLRVLDCGTTFAKVRIRVGGTYSEETAKAGFRPDARSLYKIRHIPNKRYCIQHIESGRMEAENLPTMEAASEALEKMIAKR
jgi:hypothetical protein